MHDSPSGRTEAHGGTPRRRRIDVGAKAALAAEPPPDSGLGHLEASFRQRLAAALTRLREQGEPFRMAEGHRTTDRQQWLYGSGRPSVHPYGRPGKILTNADGLTTRSKHQDGLAADCYPQQMAAIPDATDPVWGRYAAAVEAAGLVAGLHFAVLRDAPHCEQGNAPLASASVGAEHSPQSEQI